MSILGSVPVSGFVAPTAESDVYPSHKAKYGHGGYRTVANIAERDAITEQRREEGMKVFVQEEDSEYILKGGTSNTHWELAVGFEIESLPSINPVYLSDYIAVSRNGVMYKVTVEDLLNAIGAAGCSVTYNGGEVTYNGEEVTYNGYECKERVWYNGEQITYNTEEVTI